MARKLTDAQIAEIRALKHLPQRDIAERVGLSVGAVNGVLAKPKPSPAASRRVEPSDSTPVDEDAPLDVRLTRTIASLDRTAQQAEAGGDLGRSVAAQRAATQAIALAHRLAPIPLPDPNENPDYKAFGELGRRRLMALVMSEGDNDSPAGQFVREVRRIVDQVLMEKR